MALFDEGFKVGTALAIGVGAVILAPVVAPVAATMAKPMVKALIKSGMIFVQKGREIVAEGIEVMEDLAAEVKEELARAEVEEVQASNVQATGPGIS